MTANQISHNDLKIALRDKYALPYYLLLEEIGNSTGYDSTRSIDAVAFGLYASRGFDLHMFECKAHRSDWLKELRDINKAEDMAQFGDYFWIVAPKGVVKQRDLPHQWGLITVSKSKSVKDIFSVRILVRAKRLHDKDSRPLERPFVASMIVRMNKMLEKLQDNVVPADQVEDRMRAEYKRGFDTGARGSSGSGSRSGSELQHLKAENAVLKKAIMEFEHSTGLSFNRFGNNEKLAERIRVVQSIESLTGVQYHGIPQSLTRTVNQLQLLIHAIEEAQNTLFEKDEIGLDASARILGVGESDEKEKKK